MKDKRLKVGDWVRYLENGLNGIVYNVVVVEEEWNSVGLVDIDGLWCGMVRNSLDGKERLSEDAVKKIREDG